MTTWQHQREAGEDGDEAKADDEGKLQRNYGRPTCAALVMISVRFIDPVLL